MNRYFKIVLIILFVFLYNLLLFSQNERLNLKIGIYNNSPKIYIDENGEPSGFWVDITNYIAERENWDITWIKGSFAENLKKLKKNEIDIMPDVAYSESRNKEYDFNKEAMFINWGRIYSLEDDYIESLLDLRNKKIAVMKNGIHYIGNEGIKNLLERFDIKCKYIEKDSYEEVFKSVVKKEVDAGVVNRIFGNKNFDKYKLTKTPIIINPIELKFAFTKDVSENSHLINRFDYHLEKMKNDRDSIYYYFMKKWVNSLTVEEQEKIIPEWIIISLLIIIGLFVLAVIIVVVTRKQVKRKTSDLKKSEEKFKSYINHSPDGIFVLDKNGNYIDVNKTACEITGYSKRELSNLNMFDIITESKKDKAEKLFQEVVENNRSSGNIAYTNKNGEKRYLSAKAVKLSENRYLAFVSDITDKHETEKEKEKLQQQLLQAQKLESIGTLASGVAHDFNNMLTVIKGTAELILNKIKQSDKNYENIKNIYEFSKKAENLTKKILLFSRVKEMKFELININNSIKSMMDMIRSLMDENIEIYTDLEDNLWVVEADNTHIEQVLLNLAVNARDSISAEGGKLSIRTKNVNLDKSAARTIPYAEPGKYVLIEIEDTGHGIKKDIIKNIFDPFFTTKKRSQGTGMGLSVVYGIIKNHDGFINVYSEEEEGTVFKIYIPAPEFDKNEEIVGKDELINISDKELMGNQEKILIVEDEKGVLELIEDILNNYNYNYTSAESAEKALKIFKNNRDEFDLLISDIILPDMNGLELADKIRELKSNLKIIMTSGYSNEKYLNSKMDKEKYNFLQKPFSIKDLAIMIKEVLKN